MSTMTTTRPVPPPSISNNPKRPISVLKDHATSPSVSAAVSTPRSIGGAPTPLSITGESPERSSKRARFEDGDALIKDGLTPGGHGTAATPLSNPGATPKSIDGILKNPMTSPSTSTLQGNQGRVGINVREEGKKWARQQVKDMEDLYKVGLTL